MSRSVKLSADFLLDKSVTLNMIRVYTALALFPEKEGVRSPTRQQLADLTGLPLNHISQATARLVESGWLTKTGKGGQKAPAAYRFETPDPEIKSTRTESVRVEIPKAVEIIKECSETTEQLTRTDLVTVTESITVTESVRVQETQQTDLSKESDVLMVQVKNPPKAKVSKPIPPDLREIPLPDWLPRDAWIDWCDHRVAIRSPMTELAAKKTLSQLSRARDNGYSPTDLIETAVATGKWTGCVFDKHLTPNPNPCALPQPGVPRNGYHPPAAKPGSVQHSHDLMQEYLNNKRAAAELYAGQSDRQPLEGECLRVAG